VIEQFLIKNETVIILNPDDALGSC